MDLVNNPFDEMSADNIAEIYSWGHGNSIQNGRSEKSMHKLSDNRKNLIIIIVESLNTTAIEWEYDGHKAMPRLNELISDSSAISFTSVFPQVGDGRSSDGQFMYYSGVYPSQGTPLSIVCPQGPYPSLARLFPMESYETIYESKSMWNHGITNKALAFSKIYDGINYTNKRMCVADSLVLDKAMKLLAKSPEPFMASIITIGMHAPYDKEFKKSWISEIPFNDSRDKNYLEACAAFDKVLGDFTDCLKSIGLWQKSIVVIASDHDVPENCLSPKMQDKRILFSILNSGHKGFRSDSVVGQIDVFPTVLDALGLWDKTAWHGFGHSLLRSVPGYAIAHDGTVVGDTIGKSADIARQRRAIELSQQWIRATNKQQLIFDSQNSPQPQK